MRRLSYTNMMGLKYNQTDSCRRGQECQRRKKKMWLETEVGVIRGKALIQGMKAIQKMQKAMKGILPSEPLGVTWPTNTLTIVPYDSFCTSNFQSSKRINIFKPLFVIICCSHKSKVI